jgi:hypothetical protein
LSKFLHFLLVLGNDLFVFVSHFLQLNAEDVLPRFDETLDLLGLLILQTKPVRLHSLLELCDLLPHFVFLLLEPFNFAFEGYLCFADNLDHVFLTVIELTKFHLALLKLFIKCSDLFFPFGNQIFCLFGLQGEAGQLTAYHIKLARLFLKFTHQSVNLPLLALVEASQAVHLLFQQLGIQLIKLFAEIDSLLNLLFQSISKSFVESYCLLPSLIAFCQLRLQLGHSLLQLKVLLVEDPLAFLELVEDGAAVEFFSDDNGVAVHAVPFRVVLGEIVIAIGN